MERLLAAGRGIVSSRALARRGLDANARDRARRRHGLRRIGRGWLAHPSADPLVLRAVACGGALTCVDALGLAGAWHPRGSSSPHVRIPDAVPLRDAVRHVLPRTSARLPVLMPIDEHATAAACIVRCQGLRDAVAVLDSVLRLGLVTPDELDVALAIAGAPGARIRPRLDPRAESGIESLLREQLRSLRVRFRPQVVIAGVGRLDALLGDRLALEADGTAHHASAADLQRDRDRDHELRRLGFLPVRFTYADIVEGRVRDRVAPLVRAGQHRWTRSNQLWARAGASDPDLGSAATAVSAAWFAER